MAESSLSLGLPDFQSEVGFQLGFGRTVANFTDAQEAMANAIIQSGVRRVYFPPTISVVNQQGQPEVISGHVWSWLRKSATIALTSGDYDHDLPDDFNTVIARVHFSAGSAKADLSPVDPADILAMRAASTTTGTPQYFAMRPKAADGTTGQRFELLIYPAYSTTGTLAYEYSVLPNELTDDAPYPLGGMSISELILASCLAIAEERYPPAGETAGGRRAEVFRNLLMDSITRDRGVIASRQVPFSAVDSTLSYTYLLQSVGQALGYGTVVALWTQSQLNEIDSYVQSGVRRVYYPSSEINIDGSEIKMDGYMWSFMAPELSIEVDDDDYVYDLPDDFLRLREELHYAAGDCYEAVRIISISDMRELWAREETSGAPMFAAITWKTATGSARQEQELTLWPKPDGEYTLSSNYDAYADALSSLYPYPLGGAEMSEVYVASCLARIEETRGQLGVAMRTFQSLLASAIARDKKRNNHFYGSASHPLTVRTTEGRAMADTILYNGEIVD
jgi:hypothetical protein